MEGVVPPDPADDVREQRPWHRELVERPAQDAQVGRGRFRVRAGGERVEPPRAQELGRVRRDAQRAEHGARHDIEGGAHGLRRCTARS
jgi:hypothetical protein